MGELIHLFDDWAGAECSAHDSWVRWTRFFFPHVWNESFIRLTWLILVRDDWAGTEWTRLIYIIEMTHSYVWYDSFVCKIWLIRARGTSHRISDEVDMTHSRVTGQSWSGHDSFMCVTWLIHVCDKAGTEWIWRIHVCDWAGTEWTWISWAARCTTWQELLSKLATLACIGLMPGNTHTPTHTHAHPRAPDTRTHIALSLSFFCSVELFLL